MHALPRPIDTTALTERVRRRDVRRSWQALAREHPEARDAGGWVRRAVLGFATWTVPLGFLALGTGIPQTIAEGGDDVVVAVIVQSTIGLFMVLAWVLCGWTWLRLHRRRPRKRVHHRLARFAAANGMSYAPGPTGTLGGAPLGRRGSLTLFRVLRTPGPRGLEFANHELFRSTATNTSPTFGGYCAMRLPVALPNILLRSEDGPKRPLHTSSVVRDSQVLSLEGDFDRYFRLYCPAGYERDALYLFTPDVMARLVDHVRGLDVEIVDDWMYLMSARDLITDRADRWVALAAAVDALDDRVERWARWRDDRVDAGREFGTGAVVGTGAGVVGRGGGDAVAGAVAEPVVRVREVAPPGRRLRTTWGAGTIVIVGTVALGFIALVVAVSLP
ncbi:hypothetical protein [Curtobacterium sp. L1-20]|uniref:hypothetical protein n=1 Tax=Curtobacterium sp. L1-20 TaxID=3138181 RepID=UPI003B52C2FC